MSYSTVKVPPAAGPPDVPSEPGSHRRRGLWIALIAGIAVLVLAVPPVLYFALRGSGQPSANATRATTVNPSPTAAAPTPVIGRLFYLNPSSHNGKVQRWDGAGQQPTDLPDAFVGSVLNANVSPDGRWGSYVDDKAVLRVVDLRTGQTALSRNKVDGDGAEPAWAPDSRHLLIGDVTTPPPGEIIGVLDVVTGAFVKLPNQIRGTHLTWSADGGAIAYADGSGRIFTAAADGSARRPVPGLGDGGTLSSFDVESVGPSAKRIALWINDGTTPVGDVARGMYSNAVIDSRTGQNVPLAVSGDLSQVLFRSDGTMVVRVKGTRHDQIVLLSADGRVLTRADEPASLKDFALLNA